MQNVKFFLLTSHFLLLTSYFLGCSSHKPGAKLSAEDEFRVAKLGFEHKHYDEAISRFKRVIFGSPGSKWVEESQYFLAKSYFEKKDYTQAELEYDFFIRSYPRSRFADDAYFELSLCYFKEASPYPLDQSLTKKALQGFSSFSIKYPDSELVNTAKEYEKRCIDKLVRKELETAKLYVKMGKPESVLLYLKSIQETYPNNSYSNEITQLLEGLTRNQ